MLCVSSLSKQSYDSSEVCTHTFQQKGFVDGFGLGLKEFDLDDPEQTHEVVLNHRLADKPGKHVLSRR